MSDHTPPPLTPDEQYLWDNTGEPTPDLRRVESSLSQLRFQGTLRAPAQRRIPRQLLIAASLLLVGVTSYLLFGRKSPTQPTPNPSPQQTWTIASSQGDVRLAEPRALKSNLTLREVTVPDGARLTLRAGQSSTIQFENAARIELAEGPNQYPWLAMSQGSAFVQVASTDTPIVLGIHGHPITMHAGLAASVHTTAEQTRITCKTGEAHIAWPQQTTRLLGPATCTIDARLGPALPMPAAAAPEACNALDALDDSLKMGIKNLKATDALLMSFLDSATPTDAPTVWNLLSRVPPDYRRHVRDTLAKLINPPPTTNPDLILKLDPTAMDEWWKASVRAAQSN